MKSRSFIPSQIAAVEGVGKVSDLIPCACECCIARRQRTRGPLWGQVQPSNSVHLRVRSTPTYLSRLLRRR